MIRHLQHPEAGSSSTATSTFGVSVDGLVTRILGTGSKLVPYCEKGGGDSVRNGFSIGGCGLGNGDGDGKGDCRCGSSVPISMVSFFCPNSSIGISSGAVLPLGGRYLV